VVAKVRELERKRDDGTISETSPPTVACSPVPAAADVHQAAVELAARAQRAGMDAETTIALLRTALDAVRI
jgi:hypothetical protein